MDSTELYFEVCVKLQYFKLYQSIHHQASWKRNCSFPFSCFNKKSVLDILSPGSSQLKDINSPSFQCTKSCGWILKSKSSFPLRISSRSGWSLCNTSWMSSVVLTGFAFNFTITSPSLIPPLRHGKEKKLESTVYYKCARKRKRRFRLIMTSLSINLQSLSGSMKQGDII